jgi:hypothetical protein
VAPPAAPAVAAQPAALAQAAWVVEAADGSRLDLVAGDLPAAATLATAMLGGRQGGVLSIRRVGAQIVPFEPLPALPSLPPLPGARPFEVLPRFGA